MPTYPAYYLVNDRPVKLVLTHEGGLDALVFDWKCGAFVPDRSYFGKVSDVGIGKDVDSLTEAQFRPYVAELRRPIIQQLVAASLVWEATGDGESPYRSSVEGRRLTIRVNDFPAEPMYTLIAEGDEIADLEDWPAAWIKPDPLALVLRRLAERLCAVELGSESEMRTALGVPVDPPPLGASHCYLRGGPLSLATVELQFESPKLIRAELDSILGEGELLPRTGPGARFVLAYEVQVAGAPAMVRIFARFSEPPQAASALLGVTLRIDPAEQL